MSVRCCPGRVTQCRQISSSSPRICPPRRLLRARGSDGRPCQIGREGPRWRPNRQATGHVSPCPFAHCGHVYRTDSSDPVIHHFRPCLCHVGAMSSVLGWRLDLVGDDCEFQRVLAIWGSRGQIGRIFGVVVERRSVAQGRRGAGIWHEACLDLFKVSC